MKNINIIISVLALFMFWSCEDDRNNVTPGKWESDPISEYKVTPINGGATIEYTIPKDPNILYIMVEYERNGRMFTEKSSVHNNSITIEGFHGVDIISAILYKVNRKEQRSKPLEIEFKPLESVVDIAINSLTVSPDFGGIVATWYNPLATELAVRLLVRDTLNVDELITSTVYYSSVEKEAHPFRGFEAEETMFAISFEDKWGNSSDTVSFTATPYFEAMVDKPWADLRHTIPYDNTTHYSSLPITKMWDGIVNTEFNGYRSNPGGSGISFTFDLKRVVKISRIVQHSYHMNTPYAHANINEVEAWGTDKLDYAKLEDKAYWLDETSVVEDRIQGVSPLTVLPKHTFKDDWQYLGWQSQPRYDLLGDKQAEQYLSENGWEWEIPIDAEPVRYIRVFVRGASQNTPLPSDNQYSLGELTVYGDPNVPQE